MASNSQIIPNDSVFRYYFYFMQERMNIKTRYSVYTSSQMCIGHVTESVSILSTILFIIMWRNTHRRICFCESLSLKSSIR